MIGCLEPACPHVAPIACLICRVSLSKTSASLALNRSPPQNHLLPPMCGMKDSTPPTQESVHSAARWKNGVSVLTLTVFMRGLSAVVTMTYSNQYQETCIFNGGISPGPSWLVRIPQFYIWLSICDHTANSCTVYSSVHCQFLWFLFKLIYSIARCFHLGMCTYSLLSTRLLGALFQTEMLPILILRWHLILVWAVKISTFSRSK